MSLAKKERYGKEVLLLVGLLGVIAFVTAFGRQEEDIEGKATECRANLLNMATAMEMYATDNHGRFPASLDAILAPNYLQSSPVCPAAGQYRLQVGPDAPGNVEGYQDYYLFTCSSDLHPEPLAYNSSRGPIKVNELVVPK